VELKRNEGALFQFVGDSVLGT